MAERRDINKILEFLEDDHRHDLALHLFLTHLLHRVNPYFPRREWSSWPMPSSEVPEVPDIYEDTIENQNMHKLPGNDSLEEPDDQFAMSFKRVFLDFIVKRKREGHLPNAVLINAIAEVLEQKLDQKLASKGISAKPDHHMELQRVLALKIANRVSRTLGRLQKINANKSVSMRLSTWQDVQIANILSRPKTERALLASYRKSYETARTLFVERDQEYEYDSTPYGSEADSDSEEDDGLVSTVPPFDVDHHLEAIEKEETMPIKVNAEKASAELSERKFQFLEKEKIFVSAWDEAALASQLSYHHDNKAPFKTSGSMQREKEKALAKTTLDADDYRIHFTK